MYFHIVLWVFTKEQFKFKSHLTVGNHLFSFGNNSILGKQILTSFYTNTSRWSCWSVITEPSDDEGGHELAPHPHRYLFCQPWPKGHRAEGHRRLPRNYENLRFHLHCLQSLRWSVTEFIFSLEPRETTSQRARTVDCLRPIERAQHQRGGQDVHHHHQQHQDCHQHQHLHRINQHE